MEPVCTNYRTTFLEIRDTTGRTYNQNSRNVEELYAIAAKNFDWIIWSVSYSGSRADIHLTYEDGYETYKLSFDALRGDDTTKLPHRDIICVGQVNKDLLLYLHNFFQDYRIRLMVVPKDLTPDFLFLDLPLYQLESYSRLLNTKKLEPLKLTYRPSVALSRTPTQFQARQLYWANGSIPSWRVMIMMYELGLKFEAHRLKVMSTPKETEDKDFLELNPRGKTPTLVDHGNVYTESLAILEYLNETYGGLKPMMPTDREDRALIRSMMHESEALRSVYSPLEKLFHPISDLDQKEKSLINSSIIKVDREMQIWNRRLEGKEFLAGDSFTLADISFYPVIAYMYHRGMPLDAFSNIQKYYENLRGRSAVKKAFPVLWKEQNGKNIFKAALIIHDQETKRKMQEASI